MSDLRWCMMAADAVADSKAGREADDRKRGWLAGKLAKTAGYKTALKQFRAGASGRVVRMLLARGMREIGEQK